MHENAIKIRSFEIWIFSFFPELPEAKGRGQRSNDHAVALALRSAASLDHLTASWCCLPASWWPHVGLEGPINIFCISLVSNTAMDPLRLPGGHQEAAKRLPEASDLILWVSSLLVATDGLLVASEDPMLHLISEIHQMLMGPLRPSGGHQGHQKPSDGARRLLASILSQCLVIWPLALTFGLWKFGKFVKIGQRLKFYIGKSWATVSYIVEQWCSNFFCQVLASKSWFLSKKIF